MINNFDSVDKLVDFGLGIAMAQQMIKTMNTAMADINVPTVKNPGQNAFTQPPTLPDKQQFYLGIDNNVAGPFSEPELADLIREDKVSPDTLIWKPGMTGWIQASQEPVVNKYILLFK